MSDDHKHDKDLECAHCKALAEGMTQEEALEHAMKVIDKQVEAAGFSVCMAGADEENDLPHYYYTIGLTSLGLPEIMFFGMRQEAAMAALHTYFNGIRSGEIEKNRPLPHVLNLSIFNLPIHVIETEKLSITAFAHDAFMYYEREGKGVEPQFVQWVLTDKNGKAPWEKGFIAHFNQPILIAPTEQGELPNPYETAKEAVKPTLH